MTETDRIKNALANVITLAKNSIEYGKAQDDQDIDLIASIVEKEIPKKPEVESESFVGEDNVKITVTAFFCPNCGVCIGHREKYCNNCGHRIDWDMEEE